jgi:dimethylargininase
MTAPVDTAIVRNIPDSFVHAVRSDMGRTLDVALARTQHASYVRHLESAGYAVDRLDADENHPDCVFVEDAAVVVGPIAVITRSGAPSRRGETGAVAAALSTGFDIESIEAPGTLDGGDVMVLGDNLYVGRSGRTNQHGIKQLAALCSTTGLTPIVVDVHDALHLKSVVLPVDETTVLVTPNAVDESALEELRIVYEADDERHRASVLPLRDGRLLVTETTPLTAGTLASLGFEVAPIDVSELLAADGGLTCMSILFRHPLAVDSGPGQNGGT